MCICTERVLKSHPIPVDGVLGCAIGIVLHCMPRNRYAHQHAIVINTKQGYSSPASLKKSAVFEAQTLAAALFLVSSVLQADSLPKAVRSVAMQVVQDFSLAQLQQLSTHLGGEDSDSDSDSEAKDKDKDGDGDGDGDKKESEGPEPLPPYSKAVVGALARLPDRSVCVCVLVFLCISKLLICMLIGF